MTITRRLLAGVLASAVAATSMPAYADRTGEEVVGDSARGAAKGALIGAIAGDAGKGAAGGALLGGTRRVTPDTPLGDAAGGAAKGAVIGAIAGDAGKGAAAGAVGGTLLGGARRHR